MADMTAPVKPGAGAGPEAMAAYTKALDAYTKTQEAKAKAAGAAEKKIAETPYSPVDTTGKPAAPITRVEPTAPAPAPSVAPYQAQLAGQAASVPFTQGQDALAMTDEEKKVAKGQAAEKEALAAGKSAQEAKAIGLQAYMDYKGPEPVAPTIPGTAPKVYAEGEQRTGVENPKYYPETMGNPLQKTEPAKTEKPPASVESVVGKLKAEMNTSGKPNIADFIEAAAAGWNGKKAAYLEKQAKAADVKADIEKLAATAQLEKELQAEKIAADKEIAGIKAMGGVNTVGMRPGQALGAKYMAQIGG